MGLPAALLLLLCGGCQWYLDDADREVYRLVETRQRESIATTQNARLPRPRARQAGPYPDAEAGKYAYGPSPIDSNVPKEFQQPATRPSVSAAAAQAQFDQAFPDATPDGVPGAAPASVPTTQAAAPGMEPTATRFSEYPTTAPGTRELNLSDVLAYAFEHSRQYQTAKETLYLAALALSSEKHLWEPRLFATLGSDYTNLGQINHWTQSLQSVAQAGVRQRLPYRGEVVAKVIDTMVSDLHDRATDGATGQMLLEANIPLLRGAGPANYESHYQAERNLIYAVRTFETYRRGLAVQIAGDYFNLQRLRQEVMNARRSVRAFERDVGRTRAWFRTGRMIQLDVQRAEQAMLSAVNKVVDATASYQNALDQFKIRVGMPMETPIDVALPREPDAPAARSEQESESLEDSIRMPAVSEDEAVRIGHKYRLDLLNDYDQIGDAARGIAVAENNLLPDLRMNGSVIMDTDPNTRDMLSYNTERTTYKAGMALELPLDRKIERNALRKAFITKAQAERNYDEARDQVALEVRRAMRVVRQQEQVLRISVLNRNLAVERRKAFEVRLAMGGVGGVDNRDLIEAENELLDARNRLAQAQAQLSLAILQFRRDTGTLRVDEQGRWTEPPETVR